ncbi:serine carboxypeptidase [Exidia glandulosa HHB12029]|uniref:Carboxypeptidase n=1 Tax=Exidia glandulosa HHB12029 TaxID=1314781 RepID=A0A165E3D5_EXIGL|nr:serine carboxypeptidase [Exidia glandulosa HHB12029]
MRLLAGALAVIGVAAQLQQQVPLTFDAPEQELHALSSESFTTLRHPAFPRHSVRIKKLEKTFCEGNATSYAGYIDIEARHLFFYFFESRSEPDKDPVLMWINGGPGCSSAIGAFMELGPCNIHTADGPTHNPYSWNTRTNLFFLDEPIGVGFSYADHGEAVHNTEEAAVDVAAFVGVFFETFKSFEGREFHMSGESYGGRYLPVFASAVYDANAKAVAEGRTPINLKSVLIGNGITDTYTMTYSYYDMVCTNASVDPILPIESCVRMRAALPRCKKWAKEACIDSYDSMACGAAMSFCGQEISAPFRATDRNPYDISRACDGPISETLCYPLTKHISTFLDKPSTRATLGIPEHIGNFTSCSREVGAAFRTDQDGLRGSAAYVAELLQRGVRVLVYVGTYDWICNWVGNLAWTTALEWPGHTSFASSELREWSVDGERAGLTKREGALTYATVEAAGHMVPYDKPVQALAMLDRWLSGEDL